MGQWSDDGRGGLGQCKQPLPRSGYDTSLGFGNSCRQPQKERSGYNSTPGFAETPISREYSPVSVDQSQQLSNQQKLRYLGSLGTLDLAFVFI